eukprot:jgi/Tetstr1/426283/TSEL_016600.t1
MIDFACVSSTTPTWSNDPVAGVTGGAWDDAGCQCVLGLLGGDRGVVGHAFCLVVILIFLVEDLHFIVLHLPALSLSWRGPLGMSCERGEFGLHLNLLISLGERLLEVKAHSRGSEPAEGGDNSDSGEEPRQRIQRNRRKAGRMTEVVVLVSPESLHAAEAAQPHRH